MSRGDAPPSGALVLNRIYLATESRRGQGRVKAFESMEGRKTPGAKITLFTECLIYIDTFIVHCQNSKLHVTANLLIVCCFDLIKKRMHCFILKIINVDRF